MQQATQTNESHIKAVEQLYEQVAAWMNGTFDDITITKNDKIAYQSKDHNREVDSRLIREVADLKKTPTGEQIEGNHDSMKVEVNNQVALESQNGKVVINVYQQSSIEALAGEGKQEQVEEIPPPIEWNDLPYSEEILQDEKPLEYWQDEESREYRGDSSAIWEKSQPLPMYTKESQSLTSEEIPRKYWKDSSTVWENPIPELSIQASQQPQQSKSKELDTASTFTEVTEVTDVPFPEPPPPIIWNDEILIQSAQAPSRSHITPSNSPILEPSFPKPQIEKVGGLEVAKNALDKLESSPLKKLLTDTIEEMKVLQQESSQQQEQINQQQQQISTQQQQIIKLLAERTRNNNSLSNTSWWQKALATSNAIKERFTQVKAANTLHKIFHSQVEHPGKEYQSANYTINRERNYYTFKDTQGNELLKFKKTGLGVKIEGESKLITDHYEQIDVAKRQLQQGSPLQGEFKATSDRDANLFERTNRVAAVLTRYAQTTGKPVKVDGNFAYRWDASPDGDVKIEAKDGRGVLFVRSQGEMVCQMNDKDLSHFEQAFSALGQASKLNNQVRASQVER